MKPIYRLTALSIVCLALANPQVDARGRNNGNSNNQNRTEQSRQQSNNRRPGNNTQRPDNNKPTRPGNNGQQHGNNNRRPGNAQNTRPSHPQFNYGSPNNHRPDNKPQHGNHHNNRPGDHHFTPGPPPPRPHMPAANRPWHRPTPPPAFRPAPTWRPFSTILGVTLGSAINFTINSLINAGYTVTGYNNNAVYVTNVPMLNMMWPDATLYYGNRGGLCGSEFVYSTPAYNINRYNAVYNSLVATYGVPVNVSNANGVMTATWWGTGNQFINLSFTSGLAANGATRFFTTLSFGN